MSRPAKIEMLVNFAGFQAGWFACVLGAAAGYPLAGPVVVIAVVLGQMLWRRERRGDATLLLLAGGLGWSLDSLLVGLGVMAFPPEAALVRPTALWMVALWINLAATLRVSFAWLDGRWALAAVLGAVAGPLAYGAGARLGAIDLGGRPALSLALIGVEWLIAMPVLMWLAARPKGHEDPAPPALAGGGTGP